MLNFSIDLTSTLYLVSFYGFDISDYQIMHRNTWQSWHLSYIESSNNHQIPLSSTRIDRIITAIIYMAITVT